MSFCGVHLCKGHRFIILQVFKELKHDLDKHKFMNIYAHTTINYTGTSF